MCDVVDLNHSTLCLIARRGCSTAYHLVKWRECVAESTIWGRESPAFSPAARVVTQRDAHVSVAFLRAACPVSPRRRIASTINQSRPSTLAQIAGSAAQTHAALSAIVDERFR